MAETADAALAEVDQQASLLTGRLETSRLGVLIVIEERSQRHTERGTLKVTSVTAEP